MITRRAMLGAAIASSVFFAGAASGQATQPSFEQLLTEVIDNPTLTDGARQLREGARIDYDQYDTRAILPRAAPSTLTISAEAESMITALEVTSERRYRRELERPIWPGGGSGVTIGIGCDLGFRTAELFRQDWGSRLSEANLATLLPACGETAEAARLLIPQMQSVRVPWEVAQEQFRAVGIPLYVGETAQHLPNFGELSEQCRGALVSLVYNRGASFRLRGARYREMRAIRLYMVRREFGKIPAEFRSMKRIWEGQPGLRGVVIRREMEAQLFERGLAR